MLPYLREEYGNASSVHALGSRARCAVEEARACVAALVGARPAEMVFTSGGTESNNLAIQGVARSGGRRVLVTSPIEHASVREPVALLRDDGYEVRDVVVDVEGRVAPAAVAVQVDGAALVSLGWANNEIGTIQPVEEIAAVCRRAGAALHVDAVQAAGKIPVSVGGIDLLSISAHKLGGPKGVGALYVRDGLEVRPLLLGGGQERGRRAGTENVAAIVGMGEACRRAAAEQRHYAATVVRLRDALWTGLSAALDGVRRNGPPGPDGLPNTLNVSFDGVRGEALVAALDLVGIAVSSGSACAAGAGEPSHVLIGIGRSVEAARDGVRFSLGAANTGDEVERIVACTVAAVRRIRDARRAA